MPVVYLYRFDVAGEVFRYTSGSSNVVVDLGDGNETFTPQSIIGNDIQGSFVDFQGQVEMPDTLRPASDFVGGAPNARVNLSVYTRAGTPSFFGRVVDCKFQVDRRVAVLTVAPWTYNDASVPSRDVSPACGYNLGNADCGVDLSLLEVTGTSVTVSSDGRTVSSAAWGALDDGYFVGGLLRLGEEFALIVGHTGNDLTIMRRFRATAGTYIAAPGCDKSAATCAAKFNNAPRFGGFDQIPGYNPSVRRWQL